MKLLIVPGWQVFAHPPEANGFKACEECEARDCAGGQAMDDCVTSSLSHATCHGFHSSVDPRTQEGMIRLKRQIRRTPWLLKPGGGPGMYVCRFGVRTGAASGLLVLDFDERDGTAGTSKGGLGTLKRLRAEGKLPPQGATLEAKTKGGGRHLFFRLPAGEAWATWKDPAKWPFLDIKAEGGFVRVAPTVGYTWIIPPGGPFLEAPGWARKPVSERWKHFHEAETFVGGGDYERGTLKESYRQAARRVGEMAPNSGRNDALYKLACRLYFVVHLGGITRGQADALLWSAADSCGLLDNGKDKAQTKQTLQSAWGWTLSESQTRD